MVGLLINTLVFAVMFNASQSDIEFEPKQLKNEIQRLTGIINPAAEILNTPNPGYQPNGRFYKYTNTPPLQYAYVGRVFTCRAEGCSVAVISASEPRTEFFDYFILYDSDARILSVRVYNYEATHGQEITAKGWLKQFVGFSGEKELNVGKDIDAIAGATISVHSITEDIAEKTRILIRKR
ncbi:MAG: FMN-binding protein [Bacteroidales bacterium]|jgi:hypothetical protein|nr:FMN-binding protein [Bacteroidales bacterium]